MRVNRSKPSSFITSASAIIDLEEEQNIMGQNLGNSCKISNKLCSNDTMLSCTKAHDYE